MQVNIYKRVLVATAVLLVAVCQSAFAQNTDSLKRWNYDRDTDQMNSSVSYYANVLATQQLNFSFPFNGGSALTLTIRYRNGVNEVILIISKGMFNVLGDEQVNFRIRFDDEKPKNYAVELPDNGKGNAVFLDPADDIITHLKKAKKMLIEADYLANGKYVSEFNVAGLKWNHNDAKKIKEQEQAIQHVNDSLERWSYVQEVDKMTSHTEYFAQVNAHEILNLKSPYDGGSSIVLSLMYRGGRNSVVLRVSKGQFNVSEDDSLRIRFDNGNPVYVSVGLPDDGETDALFMEPANEIIDRLKKAKKLRIEIPFYNNGSYVVSFNVANLKWNHVDNESLK